MTMPPTPRRTASATMVSSKLNPRCGFKLMNPRLERECLESHDGSRGKQAIAANGIASLGPNRNLLYANGARGHSDLPNADVFPGCCRANEVAAGVEIVDITRRGRGGA